MSKLNTVHDFQKSLKKGQKGESQFFELFNDVLERLDGYVADFKIKKNGKTIELKTDSWCPTKTPNFFIEVYSYGDKPGGPFQALEKKVDYFVYYFPKTQLIYMWETKELVDALKPLLKNGYVFNIKNTAHTTRGQLVKRELLEHIAIPIEKVLGIK